MGATQSEPDYDEESEVCWLLRHKGLGSQWAKFMLRRYGAGVAPTGISLSIALPRLLRIRMHDWGIQGLKAQMGKNYVRFGHQMDSKSKPGSELFYGVTIYFGQHDRASWLWYCPCHEWHLQLHKAIVEPLPQPPENAETVSSISSIPRANNWPGRPHFLEEPRHPPPQKKLQGDADAAGGGVASTAPAPGHTKGEEAIEPELNEKERGDAVTHQLSMFLGNADGHVGLLTLPVPAADVPNAQKVVRDWERGSEVPLLWSGRLWQSAEDFRRLRERALFMPDLMLLGLETDLAMALSPDWTWERYPRGCGESALPEDQAEDGSVFS